MAHYAFLDENNIVTEVIVGIDEHEFIEEKTPEVWYGEFRGQVCKRTSYNGKIRKQFAGVGYSYDAINDVFICPKPYDSWLLNENYDWQPPIAKPNNGKYAWDEDTLSWVEVNEENDA